MELQLMTVEEVANYLKLNKQTVMRMAARGELPAAKVGRHWRFRRPDIEAYIERKVAGLKSDELAGKALTLAGVMA